MLSLDTLLHFYLIFVVSLWRFGLLRVYWYLYGRLGIYEHNNSKKSLQHFYQREPENRRENICFTRQPYHQIFIAYPIQNRLRGFLQPH